MSAKKRDKIFIPFIEGLLNYDCTKCAHSCCRGGNLIINSGQKMLLENNPCLRYFFAEKNKGTYTYRAKRYGRCWFHRDNGSCGIQATHGYSAKPFICRLHPFYPVRCGNEYVVVIADCYALYVGRGNTNTSHKLILSNTQEAIDCNHILELGAIKWSKERFNLEKKIFEASRDFLGDSNYLDFAAQQLLMTKETEDINNIKSDLLKAVELWETFLKVDDLNMENKKITYELVVLTSLLRSWDMLNQIDPVKIPVALLGLYFYMLLFSQVNDLEIHYWNIFLELLQDIPLGLVFLKREDLSLKNASIEDRVHCLRLLQRLHMGGIK